MKRLLLSLFTILILTQLDVHAQVKIGYVNPQSIMAKMPEMAAVDKKLQNFAERKQQEFAQKQSEFQQSVQEYEQKEAVISQASKETEQRKLQQMQADLQQFEGRYQVELQQKQQELVGPILQQIQDAITEVAKAEKLTYVFNTVTTTGDYILLYASEDAQAKYNITEKVIAKLGI